ncbi:MAG: alpha-amylase family glycosyl hydrolase [Bacillota bacterium]|nr:alpha-amylase family glycosyl hydrolase [Bacillota bacterium]
MKKLKKLSALVLVFVLIAGIAVMNTVSANAAASKTAETKATASQIIVHYKSTSGVPYIYYWNSLPQNIEVKYPGVAMTADSNEGANWYTYKFDSSITKINIMFIVNNVQSSEYSKTTGESWFYTDSKWHTYNPDNGNKYTTSDMRTDSIYFVITTRFYDGDTGNNVHCWDDSKANNPDSDPAWRGDFQGLIDKLDYIKALGFSAIWITPVVTNASGYDYHGYHAFDFSTVDARYESAGATYQDLIDSAHQKNIKIIQDVVWNHTGNFGEAHFAPLFKKVYTKIQDLATIETSMQTLPNSGLPDTATYYAQQPYTQYQQRLDLMKDLQAKDWVSTSTTNNPHNYYHNGYFASLNWDDYTCKFCQIAGDCVDLNSENPDVANYLTSTYGKYVQMGVDAFRVDTTRHIMRLDLNLLYNKQMLSYGDSNFFMFGEVCCRYNSIWYREHPGESCPFYTWAESDPSWATKWKSQSLEDNMKMTVTHWNTYDNTSNQPTSTNAFLDGNNYHTPDYSKYSGMSVIDFPMHWNFDNALEAWNTVKGCDQYYNDATWNVTYVESHDYSPQGSQYTRYTGGTLAWAEDLNLLFTFRGIPCLYYGGEIEFQKGVQMDVGPNAPIAQTGRAYFGDHLQGTVTATDFSKFTATGEVANTLNAPLSKQIERLNMIRRAIPALQRGQYSLQGVTGDMCFKRRYTDASTGVDSFACVAITNAATFTSVPNGTYTDAITGDVKVVTNGTLTIPACGKGDMRIYVLDLGGTNKITGAIGTATDYLK